MGAQFLYRDTLAERLGIFPKERVSLSISQNGQHVMVSCLIDGRDLSAEQEVILQAFTEEAGLITLAILPEQPVRH